MPPNLRRRHLIPGKNIALRFYYAWACQAIKPLLAEGGEAGGGPPSALLSPYWAFVVQSQKSMAYWGRTPACAVGGE
jgi:hypothetical protein